MSWERAAAFCAWLSRKEGLSYRLPTEAEWEYVRRNPGEVQDFHGEWVGDWHGAYRNVSLRDPAGPVAGVVTVIRAELARRSSQPPSVEGKAIFRVVLDTVRRTGAHGSARMVAWWHSRGWERDGWVFPTQSRE